MFFTIITLNLIIFSMVIYTPSYASLINYYDNYNISDWKAITSNERSCKFCKKLKVAVF